MKDKRENQDGSASVSLIMQGSSNSSKQRRKGKVIPWLH
jgi:hypothetical protein